MNVLEAPATQARASLRVITLVLAVACGLTVANLYYAQPLLSLIASSFHVGEGAATVVVTMTQIGYALGLMFVLPLGDLLENRRLVTRTLLATSVALLLAATAPGIGVFLTVSVLVGITSVVAQILVPMAAHMAPPDERGRFVGRVMSGLLLGILLARTVSSLVADWLGWRAIYFISAALMLVVSLVLHRVLPRRRPPRLEGYRLDSYRRLLVSTLRLVRDEPVLRWRALCQAAIFGAFSAFWTAIAYELIDEHGLSQTGIGVFALVGAAGAVAAPLGGRLGDNGHGRSASAVMLALASASMLLAALGSANLVLLALAGVLLDFAVQCHQVMGQQEIYALRADARSRINTVYMSTVFVGGAIASGGAGMLHDAYGWTGVCVEAAILPLIGLTIWTIWLRPSLLTGAVRARSAARLSDGPRD